MATTDTVVGIVGAVLLAGIMVAVFVYEYNNAPPSAEEDPIGAFQARYPLLNATEDIDADGTPNYLDADMDGYGGPDANQTGSLRVVKEVVATSPGPPQTAYSGDANVTLGSGNEGLRAWLNWTVAVPGTIPVTLPDYSMQLLQGETSVQASGQGTTTGTSRTLPLVAEAQAAGNYTLRVTKEGATPAPQTTYTLTIVIEYGPAQRVAEPDLSPK